MLDKLFNSKNRVKILGMFFDNIGSEFYGQEIIKNLKTDPANTHRELVKLEKMEILKSRKEKNHKYYKLNKDTDYFDGLKEIFTKYNDVEGGERWLILEDMPDYYPVLVANAWCKGLANDFLKKYGIKNKFSKLLSIFHDDHCSLMVVKKEFDDISNEVIEKFIKDPKAGEDYNKKVIDKHEKLFEVADEIYNTNLSKLSDRELYDLVEKNNKIYESVHTMHWFQTCSDFGDNLFSRYLMKYLSGVINNDKYSVGDVFSALTTPSDESYASKEYKDLLEILKIINRRKKTREFFINSETRIIEDGLMDVDQEVNKMIHQHVRKYGWMGYGFVGPSWGKDYYIDILSSLTKQKSDPDKLLKNFEKEKVELEKKQKEFIKDLKIDQTHRKLFKIGRDLVHSKAMRKDSMFVYYHALSNVHQEIGRRRYLSFNQIQCLYPHEFKDVILNNKFDTEILNARAKYSIYYSTGHYSKDYKPIGKQAKKFVSRLNIIEENTENVKLLQGDCASSGRVRGEVTIVNKVDEIKKMKEGNVLVSVATNPNLVPAIKKASAIVTDLGGITCHAAIISRELGIPCVIGTKIATKVLKNGDVIDVDATHGKVTIIDKQ